VLLQFTLLLHVGVVVNVTELLLMSLAKMTVQVGKTIGQAVGDSKVFNGGIIYFTWTYILIISFLKDSF